MSKSQTITVKIPISLLKQVDDKLEISGFQNRSELIRYLLRRWLSGEV